MAGARERVHQLLDECSWVVAILGGGKGLRWEYHQIVRRAIGHRVLLVIPPVPAAVIRQRWTEFAAVLPPVIGIDAPFEDQGALPLYAIFPAGAAPVLVCNRYRNETGYSVGLAALLPRLQSGRT